MRYAVFDYKFKRSGAAGGSAVKFEEQRRLLVEALQAEVVAVGDALKAVSCLIEYAGFLLRLGQGPVNARLDIRWHSTGKWSCPVLVRWHKRGRQYWTQEIRRYHGRMLRASVVPENRAALQRVLDAWFEMEEQWRVLKAALSLGKVRAGYVRQYRVDERIGRWQTELLMAHQELERALVARGVVVQPGYGWRDVVGLGA